MKNSPEFIPEKIEESEKPKELEEYRAAAEAVDDLTNALERGVWSEEQKKRAKFVFRNLDYLFDKASDDFFEVIPLALKLSKLEILFSDKVYPQFGDEKSIPDVIFLLSNKGNGILSRGIQEMLRDNKELPALDQKRVSDLCRALTAVSAGGFFSVSAVYKFFKKHKTELEHIVDAPGFEEAKKDYKGLTFSLESRDNPTYWASLMDDVLSGNSNFLKQNQEAREVVTELLQKYGLNEKDAADVLNSWLSREGDGSKPSVFDNFKKTEGLESEYPGIVKFLYEKLGIRNFDRYPLELLLAQKRDFEDREKPYGIIINPVNDWNGAFSTRYSTWLDLHQQLERAGYALRVAECGSKIEIARRLIGFDRRYSEKHKISFAFIGGHGTESTIKFGGGKSINILHIEDLAGRGVKRSSKFFEDYPTIVLISCSTGADKGIGEKLSETLGARVVAPDRPTNINRIKVMVSRGWLYFDVEYREEESKKVFSEGKKR